MMTNLTFLVHFIWFYLSRAYGAASDCHYSADDGFSLDLSSLSGDILWIVDSKWNYSYSPCQDGVPCDTASVMANQINTDTFACTSYLAQWNATVTPKKSGDAYTLTYRNGQSDPTCGSTNGNREFIARFECGSSAYSVSSLSEGDGCDYTMTIKTKYACSGSSSPVLSIGSIICISFAVLVFLYCCIGYIICAKKNPDNGWANVKENTPHLSFWCTVPKWTWAGCCVTKEFIINCINKARGTGSDTDYENVED